MKRSTLTLATLISSLFLSGCSGESALSNQASEGGALPEVQMDWPRSLQQQPTEASASTRTRMAVLSPDAPVRGRSMAYWDIRHQVTDLRWRVKEVGEYLLRLESVWREIESYCQGVADGETCRIPEGVMTLSYTQQMLDDMVAFELERFQDWGEGMGSQWIQMIKADLEASLASLVGSTQPMSAIEYVRKPGGEYDHALRTGFIDHFSRYEDDYQVRWNADKTRLSAKSEDQWEDAYAKGSDSYSLTYHADEANGDSISTQSTWTYEDKVYSDARYQGTSNIALTELNDGKNGVRLQSSQRDQAEGYQSVSQFSGEANDAGGYLNSSQTFEDRGKRETWFFKERLAEQGQFVSARECLEQSPHHCDDEGNWRNVPDDLVYILAPVDAIVAPESELPVEPLPIMPSDYSVQGLPDTVQHFVAMRKGSQPHSDWQDTLCIGLRVQGDVSVDCWGEVAEIGEADVYEEHFDFGSDNISTAGIDVRYTKLAGVRIVKSSQ